MVVTGGGFESGFHVMSSFPESNGWSVVIFNEGGYSGNHFKAHAVCKGSVTVVETTTRTTSASP